MCVCVLGGGGGCYELMRGNETMHEQSLIAVAETECPELIDEPQHVVRRAEMYHHGDQSLLCYKSLKANGIIAIGSVHGCVNE